MNLSSMTLFIFISYLNCEKLEVLNKFIHDNKGLSVELTRFYAAEIINALEYLQKQNIIHRDIKPQNILIDDNFHIKLTDFGAAKNIDPVENISEWNKLNFSYSDSSCSDDDNFDDLDSVRISEKIEMRWKVKRKVKIFLSFITIF